MALELGELAQLKLAAIARHVSQTGSAGPFHDWGAEARDAYLSTEHYRLAVERRGRPSPSTGGVTCRAELLRRPRLREALRGPLVRSTGRIGPVWRYPSPAHGQSA